MSQGESPQHLRLADLLAALSVVTDLGIGRPPETAMQACLLATRLAEQMGFDAEAISEVYFATLLRYIGCTAYAHEEADLWGGDELDARAEATRMDMASLRELLSFTLFRVARNSPPLYRMRTMALAMPRTILATNDLVAAHCEVGSSLVRRLGLSAAVQQSLQQIFERWDGKGRPHKLKEEQLCLPVRFAQVATQAIAFAQVEGPEVAYEIVRRRSGSALDPSISAAFLQHGPVFLADMASTDVWQSVVDAEPEPRLMIPESGVDNVARAFADMADLKMTFTQAHSTGVAELAEAAARGLGLPEADAIVVRRAALFHDLGRVSVPNGIWERPGPLTVAHWERVRLHPYHTERILARSPALAALAGPAGMHHERQDGSGYYRQLAGMTLPFTARLIAAADAYQAMTQERPHRMALAPAAAAEQIRAESAAGKFDGEAARAVLEAAGHRQVRARQSWPAGLSDREVEVLRLIARGSSYRDVARDLTISPRTAAHHVQHIYDKIGVSTRAAAAMFAMEHELLVR